jgi:hypothetical protein
MRSCEIVAGRYGHEYRIGKPYMVGNRYQEAIGEDIEDFVCAVVQRRVECVDL